MLDFKGVVFGYYFFLPSLISAFPGDIFKYSEEVFLERFEEATAFKFVILIETDLDSNVKCFSIDQRPLHGLRMDGSNGLIKVATV